MTLDEILQQLEDTRLVLSNGGPEDKPIFPLDLGLPAPDSSIAEGQAKELEDRKVIALSKEDFATIITRYHQTVQQRGLMKHVANRMYDFGTVIGELTVASEGEARVFRKEFASEFLEFIHRTLGPEKPAHQTVRQFAKRLMLDGPHWDFPAKDGSG